MTDCLQVTCPAKVNLSLEVLGRRPDGYHELRTVFLAVDLADTLVLRPSAELSLQVSGVPVPVAGNLCLRAAERLAEAVGRPLPAALELQKRIPVGAGLGGGSSDAAGVLVGLAEMYGLAEPEVLREVAAELGSDVPFFLQGGLQVGAGRGEKLVPVTPVPEGWLVLTRPELPISTAEAYGLLTPADYTAGERTERLRAGLGKSLRLQEVAPDLYNAFARPVGEHWPETIKLQDQLLSAGAAGALLSGSGSAVFGLFAAAVEAGAAVARLADAGYWAVTAHPQSGGVEVRKEL
jgi:4-diphosphocytidyl-2-C-methyl-D-erythritol kinase